LPPSRSFPESKAFTFSANTIATWIEERCECGKSYRDTSGNLYASWKSWAELNGEFVGSQKSFSEKLQARDGVEKTKIGDRKTRGYRGIWVIKAVEPTRSYQDD
jgi:putative DNA primase/helicase